MIGSFNKSLRENRLSCLNVIKSTFGFPHSHILWNGFHNDLNELRLIPLHSIGPEPINPASVLFFGPLPNEFNAVEIWPILDVPNDHDIAFVAIIEKLGSLLIVDPTVINENCDRLLRAFAVESPHELHERFGCIGFLKEHCVMNHAAFDTRGRTNSYPLIVHITLIPFEGAASRCPLLSLGPLAAEDTLVDANEFTSFFLCQLQLLL